MQGIIPNSPRRRCHDSVALGTQINKYGLRDPAACIEDPHPELTIKFPRALAFKRRLFTMLSNTLVSLAVLVPAYLAWEVQGRRVDGPTYINYTTVTGYFLQDEATTDPTGFDYVFALESASHDLTSKADWYRRPRPTSACCIAPTTPRPRSTPREKRRSGRASQIRSSISTRRPALTRSTRYC